MKKIGKNEGTTLIENPKHKIIDRSTQLVLWDTSDEVSLTIPNLEDSMEQLLSRQRAGLREKGYNSDGHRFYPIDPTSLTTAEKAVIAEQARLKEKLQQQNAFLESEKKRRADLKKAQDAQKLAFEAFKMREADVKDSK